MMHKVESVSLKRNKSKVKKLQKYIQAQDHNFTALQFIELNESISNNSYLNTASGNRTAIGS